MSSASLRPHVRAGSPAARTRGYLADAHKRGDTDAIPILRRQMEVEMAYDYLTELIGGWPPLTDGQKATFAGLFGAGGAA